MNVREAQSKGMHDMVSHVWCQHLQNFQTHSVPRGTHNDLSKQTGFCLGRVWWDPKTSPTNSAREQFARRKTNFFNKPRHDPRLFWEAASACNCRSASGSHLRQAHRRNVLYVDRIVAQSFADNARQQLVTRRSLVEDILESGTTWQSQPCRGRSQNRRLSLKSYSERRCSLHPTKSRDKTHYARPLTSLCILAFLDLRIQHECGKLSCGSWRASYSQASSASSRLSTMLMTQQCQWF